MKEEKRYENVLEKENRDIRGKNGNVKENRKMTKQKRENNKEYIMQREKEEK